MECDKSRNIIQDILYQPKLTSLDDNYQSCKQRIKYIVDASINYCTLFYSF